MSIAGVDGCKAGWLVVATDADGFGRSQAHICSEIGPLLAAGLSFIAVDMPIGLEDSPRKGGRLADRQARLFLQHRLAAPMPVGSRVFNAPCRAHLDAIQDCGDYHKANARFAPGQGLSKQSYFLVEKIMELDRRIPTDGSVYEVHPEVSFSALAGRTLPPKKHAEGRAARKAYLTGLGFDLDALAAGLGKRTGRWGLDDLYDACIAAWSANRIAEGRHATLPDPPQRDGRGHRMAIHY